MHYLRLEISKIIKNKAFLVTIIGMMFIAGIDPFFTYLSNIRYTNFFEDFGCMD